MRWLKQSTSADVPIGPFLDSVDGITAETALVITQADIRLKKNAAAWGQKAAAQTLTHEENGYYEVTLDATDTNTLGLMRLAVHESGALPVWEDFTVLSANVYDSLIGGTDTLSVETTSFANSAISNAAFAGGAITSGVFAAGAIDNAAIAAGAIGASEIAADAIGASELAADAIAEIADAVLTRASSNWEATVYASAAAMKSLGGAVMAATHRTRDNAGTLQIYRADGTTVAISKTITTDAANAPIDEITAGS